jgi:hypothetical protein
MTTIRHELLANGLQLHFTDESNRYFGDYHRVCVVATVVCILRDLPAESPDEELFKSQALRALGEEISVVKRMERMGVPTANVETVRTSLIDAFLLTARVYLARPVYPRSLVKAELTKHRTRRFYG